MSNLNELLKIKGVFAAGSFSDDGKLTGYAGEISEDEAAMAAAMCAANMHMARMQTDGFTAMSGESGWTPATGFSGSVLTCVQKRPGLEGGGWSW